MSVETYSVLMGDHCSGASQTAVARETGAIQHSPPRIPV